MCRRDHKVDFLFINISVKDLTDGCKVDINKLSPDEQMTGNEKLDQIYNQTSVNDLELESEE